MPQKKVSIIIVSYNVTEFLELCLDSVCKATKSVDAEIIVVDNNSKDDSVSMVKTYFPEVIIIENKENVGFSKANNQGVAIAKGEYIHFLNPDTVLTESFYSKTLTFMDAHPDAGGLGPRIIDGKGNYSVDSKKSFPSFWVSVSKVVGLSKIFPKSKVFNKYYAAHIGEKETAVVDILSGCCLLVRKEAMMQSGGTFDEQYFMYCEDVDLCHRLTQNGFKNYYYPEVTIIHYKGESTRKLTFRYMKIFYDAHALFVKKYYPPKVGTLYITALRVVLGLRNVFSFFKHLLSIFKLFLLDAILLTLTLLLFSKFWFSEIAPDAVLAEKTMLGIVPIYVGIWLISLFLNGAYDKPFSLYKAGRGMVWGLVVVLAVYGLLPFEYRFSRGITLFSGFAGTIVLLLARWFFAALNWIKLVPRGKIDYRSVIIGDENNFQAVKSKLEEHNYSMEIDGRVGVNENDTNAIDHYSKLYEIQQTLRLNEIIFCAANIPYKDILYCMERCSARAYFKIVPTGNRVILGSYFSKSNSDLFSLNKKYIIATAQSKRNKRITDIIAALIVIFSFPVLLFKVKNKMNLLKNAFNVLAAKKTWIGYKKDTAATYNLPKLKTPVLPPYQLLHCYNPDENLIAFLAKRYATEYDTLDDIRLIWSNLKYLDKK